MLLLRFAGFACATLMLLSALAVSTSAQVTRVTLIEEATNASCAPCASQNPTFEHYLNQPQYKGRFIPLIWHAHWPGRDVMNQSNPTMNKSRTDYYSINGVPTAVVNGLFQESPIDTASIEARVAAAQGTSPVEILISQTKNGSDHEVTVTLNASEDISQHTLHIVVTEGYRYYDDAGTNGEKEFYFIAREMLPGNQGTTVSLSASETKTFTESFTMDPLWEEGQIYIVAFVQSKTSKEVIQAAHNKLELMFNGDVSATVLSKTENEAHTFSGGFTVPVDGEYDFDIQSDFAAGWITELKLNGNAVTLPHNVFFNEGMNVDLSLTVTPDNSIKRFGTARVSVSAPRGASANLSYSYFNHPIDVLMFMRDERGEDVKAKYDKAFELAENWSYALVDKGDESIFTLSEYTIFAMEVGKDILYQEEIDLLKNYIDGGGRLFLAGAEIAWALADPDAPGLYPSVVPDKAFLNNYLRADYVADTPDPSRSTFSVRGFPGDPIGDGLAFSIAQGVRNQDTPDVLAPINGAEKCFYYAKQEDVAGIRYRGNGYAMVYYGFGLEGISNTSWTRDLMQKTITWLLGANPVSPVETLPGSFAIDAYPNPARAFMQVPVTLDKSMDISVTLYNVYGQKVATLFEGNAQMGQSNYSIDVDNLPVGSYMLRLTSAKKTLTKHIAVIR
jgi:outer membrane protein Omp28/type IX secretion system substrate protein